MFLIRAFGCVCRIGLLHLDATPCQWYGKNDEGRRSVDAEENDKMSTYLDGYQAGWSAFLESYKQMNTSVEQLRTAEHFFAEKAQHALPPQQRGDYWLGYHHSRAAAKTCMTKHS